MMRKDERGSVFITAIVALGVLLILGAAFMREAINNLAAASRHERTYESQNLAEAGVDMALVKLYENYDNIQDTLASSGVYQDSFAAGDGSVVYTVYASHMGLPDLVLIDSIATTRTQRQSRVRVVANYLDQAAVDRVFRGAIFCDSPLTLNGGGSVLSNSEGEGGDIYANGDITFAGTDFQMSTTGSIYTTGETNWFPTQIGASDVHEHIAPLPMPIIDLEYYRSIATTVINGNANFNSGNLNGIDGVIFVDGNVRLSGNYSGRAVIVATGSISVTGNVLAAQPENDALVLLSPKYIKIAGESRVEGLVYSHSVIDDGTVTLSGEVEIVGAVVSDAVVTNGAMNVTYSDVWDGLALPGQGKSQWAQISWERIGA